MRAGALPIAAAILVGCAGCATAAPIVSLSQPTLEANRGIELVRRHHRGRGWAASRYERLGPALGGENSGAETVGRSPDPAKPDRRHRGGWVDPPGGF
jgi:hypothetical protein